MIVFWTTRRNSRPVGDWMAAIAGSALEKASWHCRYEDWLGRDARRWAQLPQALHVFADIELLAGEPAARAAALRDFLARRGDTLNHPLESLKRLALHRVLHAAGINRFRSFSLGQPLPQDLVFPVFLRRANDHQGSRTDLLPDRTALLGAIERLAATQRPGPDWIVSEFRECADGGGLRHKYGAFVIGGQIVPRHLFFSRGWMIKAADELGPALLRQEYDYLQGNPHREALLRICALAGTQYGRIDYSMVEGVPQVWEINTNPMVFRPSHWWGARAAHHRLVRARLEQAWANLGVLQPAGRRQLPAYRDMALCYLREAARYLRDKFAPSRAV